jgi:alpha-L-fucosidase 2
MPRLITIALRSALLSIALASPGFAQSNDLKLWYEHPATQWSESLLLGNGRIGASVWGAVSQEVINLNEDTLWTGEPGYTVNPKALPALPAIRKLLLEGNFKEAEAMVNQNMTGKGSATYLPLGDLKIKFPFADDAVQGYRRELDLHTAIARTSFQSGGVAYTREVFVSYPAQALVVRLTADQPGKISFSASLSSPLHNQVQAETADLRMSGQAPMQAFSYSGRTREPIYDNASDPQARKGMRWESRLAGSHEGGTLQVTDAGIVASQCDSVTLTLVAETSYNGPAKSPSREGKDQSAACARDLQAVAKTPYDQLRAAHLADYQALFNRVSLDLGHSAADDLPTDARLKKYTPGGDQSLPALYYQFGRYMMISASRPSADPTRGGQPSNLQGLWNNTFNPPWASNWTINCNAEINYWPVEAAALPECHEPLINMVQELSVDGTRVAREFYGARGWVAHHATDLWKFAEPCGNNARWMSFICGGTWFCQHLWEHYAFSQDKDYLRRVWPTLKGAAQFHLDTMLEEPTHHWLVTGPDLNFENQWKKPDGTIGAICMGPTPSMQMIRELFRNCIAASRTLEVDPDFRAELEKALPRLAPMQISPTTGELQEYLEDWQHTAKAQVLSSWGAICSDQISPRTTPGLAAGLKKIFDTERWWEKDCLGSWEGAFQANAYARLHDGATAGTILELHLQKAVQDNFGSKFIGHPPPPHPGMFQVDGNFGQTSAINEMLLQSQVRDPDGVYEIELLPALPPDWQSGQVHGLRARGGFQVDISWSAGKLTSARINPLAGVKTRVRYGDKTLDLDLGGAARDLTAASFGQ